MSGNALIDELVARWEEFQARGEEISTEDLCPDHPELLEALGQALTRRRAERGRESAEEFKATPVVPPTVTIDAVRGDDIAAAADGLGLPQGSGEIGRLGPFRLVKLLGGGGMGAVYQAVDSQLGRSVAVKVMRPRLADCEEARGRFLREARAAAALEHDHVVPIYQVGEDNGIPYLAMPVLRGQSLRERLRRVPRLSGAEVLRIGREIAEGLAAAHELGLIHRDIKPANIWIEEGSGRVKILDFGLARVANETARLTQDGTILGTPAYMAPEQASGSKDVGRRSDMFSLGSALYRMVTGRRAFPAESTAALLLALVQ
jgi:serine/threonine protein kinase